MALGQFLTGGWLAWRRKRADAVQQALEHTNWTLWHGKLKRALEWRWLIEGRMWHFERDAAGGARRPARLLAEG